MTADADVRMSIGMARVVGCPSDVNLRGLGRPRLCARQGFASEAGLPAGSGWQAGRPRKRNRRLMAAPLCQASPLAFVYRSSVCVSVCLTKID